MDRRQSHLRNYIRGLAVLAWLLVLLVTAGPPTPAFAQEDEEPGGTVEPVTIQQIAKTETFYASQDTYIASGYPTYNFGGSANLNLGWQAGGSNAMRILIQFDLSKIPANAQISRATYHIYQSNVNPPNDYAMDFRAQFARQGWSEFGANWNNAASIGGDAMPLGSIPGAYGWQQGEATNAVRDWVSGRRPNNGMLITGDEVPGRNRSRGFYSRQQAGYGPYMVVQYTTECDTVPPVAYVVGLPAYSPGLFLVSWTGQDYAPSGCRPSGIANYDVQYRVNGGAWVNWKNRTTATSNHFKNYAPDNAFVEFRARATDNVGNIQSWGNPQTNTRVDDTPPVATVNPLPEYTVTPSFMVTWSGYDNGSGIDYYDVEWQVDQGEWQPLISETKLTSFEITGAKTGSTYNFRARGVDKVGNVQSWPANPQASTFIFAYPIAIVDQFVPPMVKPTDPVTTSFKVTWYGFTAPGTTITQYQIYYNYVGGGWTLWRNFDSPTCFGATPCTADFPFLELGLGDGLYLFRATAMNNLGEREPLNEAIEASIIVDLADRYRFWSHLPLLGNGN